MYRKTSVLLVALTWLALTSWAPPSSGGFSCEWCDFEGCESLHTTQFGFSNCWEYSCDIEIITCNPPGQNCETEVIELDCCQTSEQCHFDPMPF